MASDDDSGGIGLLIILGFIVVVAGCFIAAKAFGGFEEGDEVDEDDISDDDIENTRAMAEESDDYCARCETDHPLRCGRCNRCLSSVGANVGGCEKEFRLGYCYSCADGIGLG